MHRLGKRVGMPRHLASMRLHKRGLGAHSGKQHVSFLWAWIRAHELGVGATACKRTAPWAGCSWCLLAVGQCTSVQAAECAGSKTAGAGCECRVHTWG